MRTLSKNEIFQRELPSNPTTGYRWNVSLEGESVQLVDRQFRRTEKGLGGGGVEVFRFQAVEGGETRIKFQYKRGWEQEAIKERIYTVVVRDPEEG